MASAQSLPHGTNATENWNILAEFWDRTHTANGNIYWSKLQEPCLRRFMGDHLKRQDCQALEFACGNGLCSRWMAAQGARVLATDGAPNMLERAKAHGTADDKITFQKVDVTSERDMGELVQNGHKFDVVLMNMAIMDVSTLEYLAQALPKLLKQDGVFVATLLHPVFMTSIYSRTADSKFDSETLNFKNTIGKNIIEYLHVEPYKGVAIPGQEHPQVYFHRPIHELFSIFFKAGLVMDGLEEPCFTQEDGDSSRMLSTSNFTQLPPILGFRLRLMS